MSKKMPQKSVEAKAAAEAKASEAEAASIFKSIMKKNPHWDITETCFKMFFKSYSKPLRVFAAEVNADEVAAAEAKAAEDAKTAAEYHDSMQRHKVCNNRLSFPNRLTRRRVTFVIDPDGGKLLLPKELREPITRPLQFFAFQKCFFARHRRQQAQSPLCCVVAECSPCGRVRVMLPCVAFACQRLVTTPANVHMTCMSWSWAEVVMERVTRGRVKKVQETLADFQAAAAARVVSLNVGRGNCSGCDIFFWATNGDVASLLCHLIANDADVVNKRGEQQQTPLHESVFWRHDEEEVTRLLLQCNADVNARSDTGWTPLHRSGHSARACAARLLLEFNADIEARDNWQNTPLHASTCGRHGAFQVFRILVESKADVTARNIDGDTALKMAIKCNQDHIAEYLRSIGAPY